MADGTRFRNSYFKTIRSYIRHLASYLFVLLTIVNNGNIWSDGKDPGIRCRRHNKMEIFIKKYIFCF